MATKTPTAEKKIVKKSAPKKEALKDVAAKPAKAEPATAVDTSKFAIVETGGKQYRVSVGESVKIEKILLPTSKSGEKNLMKEGDLVTFDKVLLTETGSATNIGAPYIPGAKVTGKLVEIGRDAKVIVIKFKQKSRYFKKNGHRQPFFKVKIDNIS
jgi:large subunit ribosomal protein L21